jgi:hypothetical protein
LDSTVLSPFGIGPLGIDPFLFLHSRALFSFRNLHQRYHDEVLGNGQRNGLGRLRWLLTLNMARLPARRLTLRGGPIPTGHIVGSKSASLQRLIHVHAGLGLDEEWLPALHAFVQSLRTLCAHVGVPAWQDNRRALIEREGIKANDAVQVYNVH